MTKDELQKLTLESLRDWFKKEKWVRITTSGNIAGPCGTSKNKKNPDRCLPKAKAQSLSKAERAATARKKKAAGKKGKTVVKNTEKATVRKEEHAPLDLHYKKGYKDLTGLFNKITRASDIDTIKKLSHVFVDNLKKASKIQRAKYKADIQKGTKNSIFNLITNLYMNDSKMTSGLREVTKEDIRNLVVGTIAELKNENTITEKDDRCTRIAKRKYDTWPSAYASGAVVRCRRGEIWKGVSEEVIQESDCKHGRYYCNHDKKYKCRKGPKKSR